MIISTVVPRALHNLQLLAVRYFGVDALVAGREPVSWGIALKVDEPQAVGADRAGNAISAQAVEPGKDKLVISFGTATTLDHIGPDGAYLGGIIAPGVNLSLEALGAAAAKLPRIAILSAVETVTAKIPSTLEAAALCKMADRGQITGGLLDGPLAFDNAVDMEAARIKGIKSEVAGRAQILVVPDLESGNMLAKNLAYFAKADGAGIVLGARVPIVLTSRADSLRARMASCAVATLYADARRRRAATAA